MTTPAATRGVRPKESQRALLFADSKPLARLIELTLNHGLFGVRTARTMSEVEAILGAGLPDVAIIDMDHDDGVPLLTRFGADQDARIPVLGLTRRGDLTLKLKAFDLGADDILASPFSPDELLARVVVITRRATRFSPRIVPRIRLGEIEIDILNREVRAGDSVVHLSGLDQNLLYLLASHAGRVVTREEILDAIWGTDHIASSNIVDRHVRSLRIKLRDDHRHPRFIETVPGQGYRFCASASPV